MQKICDGFEKSKYMNEIKNDFSEINDSRKKDESNFMTVKKMSPYKSSVLTQFKWLTWRNALGIIRNPMTSRIQIIQTIVSKNYFNIYKFNRFDIIEILS